MLKSHINDILLGFNRLFESEHELSTFTIDCSKMTAKTNLLDYTVAADQDDLFSQMFQKLNTIRQPALYWFEADNEDTAKQLIADLDIFRKVGAEKNRTVPAQNKNSNSNVIYVGVRQGGYRKKDGFTQIAGRIIIHLGYYRPGSTQGLQLAYWAKYPLKLNVIALPQEALPYLYILEKMFALKYKPLCGKH